MQSMKFANCPPGIRKYVASIFRGETSAGVHSAPALPGQVWTCASPAWWVPHDGALPEPLPIAGLMGPSVGAHKIVTGRTTQICGVSFTTLGWVELVRLPASELANRVVDARDVWPALIGRLLDTVLTARTWDEQATHLSRFVRDLVAQTERSREQGTLAAIDRWIRSDQAPAVLCSVLGYSERQVERITARTHGGSPRFLRVRHRALRQGSLLAKAAPPALDCSSYSDQSHYIREFRRFVGSTPAAFLRQDRGTEILRAIFAQGGRAGESEPLGLIAPYSARASPVANAITPANAAR